MALLPYKVISLCRLFSASFIPNFLSSFGLLIAGRSERNRLKVFSEGIVILRIAAGMIYRLVFAEITVLLENVLLIIQFPVCINY